MGWGVGMGIGWSITPNGSGSILIRSCSGTTANVYLDGEGFVPPTKAYLDAEFTTPFNPGIGTLWNLPELIDAVGGYNIFTTGEVKGPLIVCPV